MAATKATVIIQASANNVPGAITTGAGVDLTAGYGAVVNVRMANGITPPTLACRCDIESSTDNITFYKYRTVWGTLISNDVTTKAVDIPIGHKYVRTVFYANTGQPVSVASDGTNVTIV